MVIIMGKSLKKVCWVVVVLSVFAGIAFIANAYLKQTAAATPSPTANDVYEYPVYPGDAKWAEYSPQELTQMLQIPEDILAKLTTEELVKVVVDYPYLSDMFYYNTLKAGIDEISVSFNGLGELLKREDAGICLVEYYKNIDFTKQVDLTEVKFLKKTLNYNAIEVILAQEKVLATIPQNVREEFERLLNKNIEYCNKNSSTSYSKCGSYYEALKER